MASRQEGAARPHHNDRRPDHRSRLGRVEPVDPRRRAGATDADRGAPVRAYHPARDQGGWDHGKPLRNQGIDQPADRPETLSPRLWTSLRPGSWLTCSIEGAFTI